MNKKGQALIEFIIILPIIIYLFLSVIDYSIIIYKKNNLESKINDVIDLFTNAKSEEINELLNQEDDNIIYNISSNNEYATIELKTKVELITPGLDLILGKPYYVKSERVIKNE